MICALDNKPNVRAEIQNLADKIGADYNTAKIIYENNNGYSLDKAPNGAESKLYKDLLEHYKGDENKALIAKAKTYLQPFFNWFGDWTQSLSQNNNPYDENISISDATADYDSADADGPGTLFIIKYNDKPIGQIAVNATYVNENTIKPWGDN